MNISIRGHIKNNFKDLDPTGIKQNIIEAISKNEETTLPGLGVLFEELWNSSDEVTKSTILDILHKKLGAS